MTATTVSNAVATRDASPIKFMWTKISHLRTVLPKSVDVEAFLGTAAGALYASDVPGKNITLMKCAQANPDSLYVALIECAALGHMPGTDEYYLTPRMDHGRPKVLGIEGYKGVVERMYRSGAVANVIVREVCADDPFEYIEGRDDIPRHEIGGRGTTGAAFFGADGDRKRGRMVGAYAYAKLLTGAYSRVVVLRKKDVLAARDAGGYKPDDSYSPWNRMDAGAGEPEFQGRSMWWKTAAKRLEPWVPTSAEYRREQLRASAAAVTAAERPAAAIAQAAPGGARDVVDAEIVDEPQQQPAPQAAPKLEQAPPRRPRGQRQEVVPPEDVPFPGDAAPARPAAPVQPFAPDDDPRAAAHGHLNRLGIPGHENRMNYVGQLLDIAPPASLESLARVEAARLAGLLAGCRDKDALDVLLATGEVPGDGQ